MTAEARESLATEDLEIGEHSTRNTPRNTTHSTRDPTVVGGADVAKGFSPSKPFTNQHNPNTSAQRRAGDLEGLEGPGARAGSEARGARGGVIGEGQEVLAARVEEVQGGVHLVAR